MSVRGTICHETPQRSVSQEHLPSSPALGWGGPAPVPEDRDDHRAKDGLAGPVVRRRSGAEHEAEDRDQQGYQDAQGAPDQP